MATDASEHTPAATSTIPASLPAAPDESQRVTRFLLLLDVENAFHTHESAGLPFEPAAIRDVANEVGTIAFAFAYGNLDRVPSRVRENLLIAGFPLVHCQRFRNGNGGKDTVDEHIQDIIRRFITYNAVDGVIMVTDDRNFAPIMHGVLDANKRLIRLTLRGEAMLDRIGEVRRLAPEDVDGQQAAVNRRWTPEFIIEDLRRLPSLTEEERESTLRRIRLRSPFVHAFLRMLIRRYWRQYGASLRRNFTQLFALAEATIREEDRSEVSYDDVRSFLSTLIEIGVIQSLVFQHPDGGERRGYIPNWDHPFCAAAIADIREVLPIRRRIGDGQQAPERDGSVVITGSSPVAPAPNGTLGTNQQMFFVANRATNEVLEVEAADAEEAITRAHDYYRDRDDITELAEPERALLLSSLHVIGQPPNGITPTRIKAE